MRGAYKWALLGSLPVWMACSGNVSDDDAQAQADAAQGAFVELPAQPSSVNSAHLPLCQLAVTCAQAIVDAEKVDCKLAMSDTAGAATYQGNAGVELRGRTSLKFPKKNYSIELRDGAGEDNPANLLGAGEHPDWVLDGSWMDRSFMRNPLVFDLFRSLPTATSGAEHYAARSRFCELTLNGAPQGVYRLGESIKRDEQRVNLSKNDGTASSFLIEQDDEGAVYMSLGLEWRWKLVYPKQGSAAPAQISAIQDWLNAFDRALSSAKWSGTGSSPSDGLFTRYLDLDSTVDWILINEFSKNIDAYNLSVHLARTDSGRAFLVPWDYDLSFGQPTVDPSAAGESTSGGNDSPRGWIVHRSEFIRILQNLPEVKSRLAQRWRDLRAGAFSNQQVFSLLNGYAGALPADALSRNFAIWPIANVDFKFLHAPYSLYPVTSYGDEVEHLRGWVSERLAWMDVSVEQFPN